MTNQDAIFEGLAATMDAILDATPDGGEGSTYHLRSQTVWEIVEDYRRADPGVWQEGQSRDDVRAMCIRDAARCIASWLEAK